APDVSHANRVPYMVVDAVEARSIFTKMDLIGIGNLFANVIWNGSTKNPQFTNYIDGDNAPYGSRGAYANGQVYSGWITLGAYHSGVQTAAEAALDAIIAGVRNPSLDYMDTVYGKIALAGHVT